MTTTIKQLTGLCLCALVAAPLWAAPQVPDPEVRVNQSTVSKNRNPAAVFDASGRALLVWENEQLGLQARFTGRDERNIGPELGLVANQLLSGIPAAGNVTVRKEPAVAFLSSGQFVLAWTEERAFLRVDHFYENRQLLDRDIFAQVFGSDGRPAGAAFRVNAAAAGFQSQPRLAARGNDVLVVWGSDGLGDRDADGVYGRAISRTGLSSPEFKIAAAGANPSVAVQASGDFAVVWDANDGSSTGIFAQLFDRNRTPRGSELRVNTSTAGLQRRASIAPATSGVGANGGYLVVWQGQGETSRQHRIFGQFVGNAGNLLCSQLALSNGANLKELAPTVALGKNGGFVTIWLAYDETFPRGIFALELDAQGAAVGDIVRLNQRPIGANTRTMMASDTRGFAIPWEGYIARKAGITVQMATQQ
jgi:hypothetical protein